MIELAGVRSERRKHSRRRGTGLVAEIRGKRYAVLDISFGGIKLKGQISVAGGLIDLIILPGAGNVLIVEENAEGRGRVERVDGDLTAVRFNNLTDALAKLISRRMAE